MKKAHGIDGVKKFIQMMKEDGLHYTLDIGCGKEQTHAKFMEENGLTVDTIDFFLDCTFVGNYNEIVGKPKYDGIHAAHVLEHQPNPNIFLQNIHFDLNEGGWLCLTVPPLKHKIVGGHVSLWNAGLILYHLVLAGFDCKEAKIKEYGYNISVVVRKKTIKENPKLVYDSPDMNFIKKYIPAFQFTKMTNAFNGDIKDWNW